jgi:integrase
MGLYRRPDSSIWWVSYTKGGKQVRESTFTSDKEEAKLRLAEAVAGLKRPGKATVGKLLDGVLADYRLNGFNLKFAEDKIDGHLRPWFGEMLAETVTKQDVQDFINTKSQGEKSLSNASINRCLALLKRAFNLAEIPHPTITMLKEAPPRSGFVEKEKFWVIFNRLPEHQRAPVLFAYESGARIQEVLNLRWNQLDWINGVVRLDPGTTKNDDARVIPCSKMMMFYFKRLPHASEYVFTFKGKHLRSIRTGWLKAVGKSKLLVHDLRRSGVRNLIRAGVPERVAMQISGHKTRSVFDRYNIVSENDLTNAMRSLEKYHLDTIEYNPETVPELAEFFEHNK